MGGDPGAHDLRRVLRLPGSRNYKKRYAPTYPKVAYVTCNLSRQYKLAELVALLPAPAPAPQPTHRALTPSPRDDGQHLAGVSVIEAYNATYRIEDTLGAAGYIPSGKRFVRPGGASPSVMVFPDSNTSFHHSSSDSLHSEHARTPFDILVELEYASNVKEAVKAAAHLLGMERPSKQEQDAADYGLFLAELKLWVRTTSFAELIPIELKGQHYRTDGTDTKVADAVLGLMEQYNRLTVYTTKRKLGLAAGVSGDTALHCLTRLGQFLFTVAASQEKGLTITLREEFCLAQLRHKAEEDPFLANVRETNEYSLRKNTDPFLTGASRQIKEQCNEAAAVAGGILKEWLATVPKGLGETALRVLDALERCGEMTVQELAHETGKTTGAIWRACRRLEGDGLLLSAQEHNRAPKVYELAPAVWQQVERLAPNLRTYRLSVEREDRYLKDSQLWTAAQKEVAIEAGEQEQAAALDKRLMRLGNQRMNTLSTLYAEKNLTQAELAQLAFDVHVPALPHPALMAKLRRFHETARMAMAAARRAQEWQLTNTTRTLRNDGVNKKEVVRMLQLAGYTPKEAWGAVYRVWATRGP